MSTKFFQKKLMASEDVNSYNRSIIYTVSSTPTEITNGGLVTLVSPSSNIWGNNDLTTYNAAYPTADTDPVYITDIVESPYATYGTNNYRVVTDLTALKAPANTPVRARKPKIDDEYLVGDGNFASAPTVGQYAIPTAGALTYTPSATAITTKHCVKIIEQVSIGVGVSSSITAYRVRVVTSV